MNFTALFIISQIDDIVFKLIRRGYFFGFRMAEVAAKIEKMEFIEERSHARCYRTSYFIRSLILGNISFGMILYVSLVAELQTSGYFLNVTYTNCNVTKPSLVGNGKCDFDVYNTEECGFDGGDCIDFNTNYPNCTVEDYPNRIGDEECHGGAYNTEECGFDGGDGIDFNTNYPNCTVDFPSYIGDGFCNGEGYNTEECGWDGGDCL